MKRFIGLSKYRWIVTACILLSMCFSFSQAQAQNDGNDFGVSILGAGLITGYLYDDDFRIGIGITPFWGLALGASIDILNDFPIEGESSVIPYWGYGATGSILAVTNGTQGAGFGGVGASALVGIETPVGENVALFFEAGGGLGIAFGGISGLGGGVTPTPIFRLASGVKF